MNTISAIQVIEHCKRHKLNVPENLRDAVAAPTKKFEVGNGEVLAMSVTLNLRTVSEANKTGDLKSKMSRKKAQRTAVRNALARIASVLPQLPARITLTRFGLKTLDDDNLASAMKHVRDGVADVYGPDDADPRYEWVLAQQKSKRYAVEIRIERIEE